MTFYDEHPFDWAPADWSREADASVPRSLADLIGSIDSASLVLDIGCGPGRVLSFLRRRGLRCIGLDSSRVSVVLAVERCGVPGVVADNLQLPVATGAADVVISDGVIHHTDNPQKSFEENLRVLKPGGQMYIAVYKPSGHYPWLYKYPGEVVRRGLRHRTTTPLVVLFAQLPYFLAHLLKSRGRRTWAGARNLFYDYFVSPRVEFLPRHVVEQWCADRGAEVLHYDENRGLNVHSFIVRKNGSALEAQRNPPPMLTVEVLIGENQESS
jgi:SAM-dependent methyltransferase